MILILLLLVIKSFTLNPESMAKSVFSLVCVMDDMDEVEKYKIIRRMSESDLQKAIRYKGYLDNDFINEGDKVSDIDDIDFIYDGLVGVNVKVLEKEQRQHGGDSGYSSRANSNTSTPTDEKSLLDAPVCYAAGAIVFSSSEEEEMEEELIGFEDEMFEVRMKIDKVMRGYVEWFC